MADDLAPPPGFVPIGSADQLPPPPGFVPISQKPEGWDAVAANAATGLARGFGNFVGMPQAIGNLVTTKKAAGTSWVPDPGELAAKYWPSPEGVTNWIFNQTGAQPYEPETAIGKIGQAALSNAVPALLSGGVAGAGTRLAAGMASGAGGQAVANVAPDSYWTQLAASLAGALGGGALAGGAGGIGRQIYNIAKPEPAAEATFGRELAANASPPAAASFPPPPSLPPQSSWAPASSVAGSPAAGQLVAGGGATPATSGGGFGDILSRLAGPALGFGLEHIFEGVGGAGGAMLGKYAGDIFHEIGSQRASAALQSVRQKAQSDPAYAAKLLLRFNSSPGWQAYLAQRAPFGAVPAALQGQQQ